MKCMHNLNAHYEVHKQVHKAQNKVTLNRKFTKYASPFPFYFEAKVGRGHLVENCICPLHRSSQSLICARSTIGFSGRMTTFAERLLWEISDAFVDAELRGIEVTCIVVATGDNLA